MRTNFLQRSVTAISKLVCVFFAVSLSAISTTAIAAGGSVSVEHVQIVKSSAAAVWEKVGNFGGIHAWHPAITATDMKGDGKTEGDTRTLTLGDGATIAETLLGYDAKSMVMSYEINESPLPIKDYESKISVEELTDGTTKVKWVSTLNSKGVPDAEAAGIIKGIYEGGLKSLSEMF